ncbi:MAG: hypothetical protein HC838_08400 [Spirulinaceae cyanobacterium RM2_2_10]|nr:hypothetical protein [Spirulinaceae cyanobacterium RM2_2_10]
MVSDLPQILAEALTPLHPLIPPGTTCALLDYPSYPNLGDHLIWLGAVLYLRDRTVTSPTPPASATSTPTSSTAAYPPTRRFCSMAAAILVTFGPAISSFARRSPLGIRSGR